MDENTHPHDAGEWLKGHAAGVLAGRRDVLGILSRLAGRSPLADWLLAAVLRDLEVAAEKESAQGAAKGP